MSIVATVVVGNPNPNSRTLLVAETLMRKLVGPAHEPSVNDVVAYAADMYRHPSPVLDGITAHVARSDLVVFASPTYKASYSGLLKTFLDRFRVRSTT